MKAREHIIEFSTRSLSSSDYVDPVRLRDAVVQALRCLAGQLEALPGMALPIEGTVVTDVSSLDESDVYSRCVTFNLVIPVPVEEGDDK